MRNCQSIFRKVVFPGLQNLSRRGRRNSLRCHLTTGYRTSKPCSVTKGCFPLFRLLLPWCKYYIPINYISKAWFPIQIYDTYHEIHHYSMKFHIYILYLFISVLKYIVSYTHTLSHDITMIRPPGWKRSGHLIALGAQLVLTQRTKRLGGNHPLGGFRT